MIYLSTYLLADLFTGRHIYMPTYLYASWFVMLLIYQRYIDEG